MHVTQSLIHKFLRIIVLSIEKQTPLRYYLLTLIPRSLQTFLQTLTLLHLRFLHHYLQHWPANLEIVHLLFGQHARLLKQNQCPKLRLIVFQKELSLVGNLDQCVKPWHWYIRYPDISILASSHLDWLALLQIHNMNDLYMLLGHTLEHYVVFGSRLFKWQQVSHISLIRYNHIRELKLTQFTLHTFPTIRLYRFILFDNTFWVEPLSQTFDVDKLHGAIAFTRRDKGIILGIVFTQAYSAASTPFWRVLILWFGLLLSHFLPKHLPFMVGFISPLCLSHESHW